MKEDNMLQTLISSENLIRFINSSIEALHADLKPYENIRNIVRNSTVDHIAIKVGSLENYVYAKVLLRMLGALISEEIIPMNIDKGRPIAIFKLKVPLKTNYGQITLLELISPKPNLYKVEADKLDHIELVLPPNNNSLKLFFSNFNKLLKSAGLTTDEDIEETRIDLESGKINPDFKLSTDRYKVKFHEKNIETVVLHEQSSVKGLRELYAEYDKLYPEVLG